MFVKIPLQPPPSEENMPPAFLDTLPVFPLTLDEPSQLGYDRDHSIAAGKIGKGGVSLCHLGDFRDLFFARDIKDLNFFLSFGGSLLWGVSLLLVCAEERNIAPEKLRGDFLCSPFNKGSSTFFDLQTASDLVAWGGACGLGLKPAFFYPRKEGQEFLSFFVFLVAFLEIYRKKVRADDFLKTLTALSVLFDGSRSFFDQASDLLTCSELWSTYLRERCDISGGDFPALRYGLHFSSSFLGSRGFEGDVFCLSGHKILGEFFSNMRLDCVFLEEEITEKYDLLVAFCRKAHLLSVGECTGGVLQSFRDHFFEKFSQVPIKENFYEMLEAFLKMGCAEKTQDEVSDNVADGQCFLNLEQKKNGFNDDLSLVSSLFLWRNTRNLKAVCAALDTLREAAGEGKNVMEASLMCARVGVTTGEWRETLRRVWEKGKLPVDFQTISSDHAILLTPDSCSLPLKNAQNSQEISDFSSLSPIAERIAMLCGRSPRVFLGILKGENLQSIEEKGVPEFSFVCAMREIGFEVIEGALCLTPVDVLASVHAQDVDVVILPVTSCADLSVVREVSESLTIFGLGSLVVGALLSMGGEERNFVEEKKAAGVVYLDYSKRSSLESGLLEIEQHLLERRGIERKMENFLNTSPQEINLL